MDKRQDRTEQLAWCKNDEDREAIQQYLDNYDWATDTSEKFTDPKVCCICGESGLYWRDGKKYCQKHKHSLVKYGRLQTHNRFTPNGIRFDSDYAYVILRDWLGSIKGESKIDKIDVINIIGLKWHLRVDGYCCSDKIPLHRHLLGLDTTNPLVVDHIDRDPLNNTQSNLRAVTQKVNMYNRGLDSRSKTGYTGVHYLKDIDKFSSCVQFKGKKIHLGCFSTKEEAYSKRLSFIDSNFSEEEGVL